MSSDPVPMDEKQVASMATSLKTFYKLCVTLENRDIILKDKSFLQMVLSCLSLNRSELMKYLVRILIALTEKKEHAAQLADMAGMAEAVGSAADFPYDPKTLHNLLVVSSRLKSAKAAAQANAAGDTPAPAPRRFVAKKSRQLVYVFDELSESLRSSVERAVLATRGVISIYFDSQQRRAVIRTTLAVDADDMTDAIFSCGVESIGQIMRTECGEEEMRVFATERAHKKPKVAALPDYLDDLPDVVDPNSCVMPNVSAGASGGWFGSIGNFIRTSIW